MKKGQRLKPQQYEHCRSLWKRNPAASPERIAKLLASAGQQLPVSSVGKLRFAMVRDGSLRLEQTDPSYQRYCIARGIDGGSKQPIAAAGNVTTGELLAVHEFTQRCGGLEPARQALDSLAALQVAAS